MSDKIPPEILHLLEKRSLPDRRKNGDAKPKKASGASSNNSSDRRRKDRRKGKNTKRKK